jgi:hypothetical protein
MRPKRLTWVPTGMVFAFLFLLRPLLSVGGASARARFLISRSVGVERYRLPPLPEILEIRTRYHASRPLLPASPTVA